MSDCLRGSQHTWLTAVGSFLQMCSKDETRGVPTVHDPEIGGHEVIRRRTFVVNREQKHGIRDADYCFKRA